MPADLKPKPRRFYTPIEVSVHASPEDCWVSFLGHVYDLTPLVKENEGPLVQPLLKAAGSDISHWFNEESGDVRTHMDPITNLERPYCPMGRFLHVAPQEPVGDWDTDFTTPWWKDAQYKMGKLAAHTRVVRIKNVLTGQEDTMEVPSEEMILEIRERYLEFNWHAASYSWKVLLKDPETEEHVFTPLDMELTLEENNVPDDAEEFDELGIDDTYYIPVIHLYYNDDLTVA